MAQTERLASDRATDEFLIDTDFHLHIPYEKLYPYVKDRMVLEKLEKAGPPPFRSGSIKGGYSTDYETEHIHERPLGEAMNRNEIAGVMDEMATDAVLVTPGTHMPLSRTIYPTVSNALVKAYNDYLLDEVIDVEKGIYGLLFIPHWDVDFAIEELDRLGNESGFVGAANWITTDRLWGDISYDPMYEKLLSYDLSLFVHISSHNTPHSPQLVRESMRTHTENLLASHGWAVLANVTNMVMTGLFEKYPDLNVVLQEGGTNWVPLVAWRADELYQAYPEDVRLTERLRDMGEKYLPKLPSKYVFENLYTTTQPISLPNVEPRSHIQKLLEVSHAEDMFMYSSDWPHATTDPANWLFDIPIDDDLRSTIAHKNAESVIRAP